MCDVKIHSCNFCFTPLRENLLSWRLQSHRLRHIYATSCQYCSGAHDKVRFGFVKKTFFLGKPNFFDGSYRQINCSISCVSIFRHPGHHASLAPFYCALSAILTFVWNQCNLFQCFRRCPRLFRFKRKCFLFIPIYFTWSAQQSKGKWENISIKINLFAKQHASHSPSATNLNFRAHAWRWGISTVTSEAPRYQSMFAELFLSGNNGNLFMFWKIFWNFA